MSVEIANRGFDITGDIWASKILGDTNGRKIIRDIHRDFLIAGADIIIDCNYSSYVPKMMEHLSISEAEAEELIVNTTALAVDVRDSDEYTRDINDDQENRPLVAGSLGSFGKYFGKREECKSGKYEGLSVE